jgi:hypothetical protein
MSFNNSEFNNPSTILCDRLLLVFVGELERRHCDKYSWDDHVPVTLKLRHGWEVLLPFRNVFRNVASFFLQICLLLRRLLLLTRMLVVNMVHVDLSHPGC